MKRLLLLVALCALAGMDLASAQQVKQAQIGITPTTVPEVVQVLDNTGTWVPFGNVDPSAHVFSPLDRSINVTARGAACDGSTDDAPKLNAFFAAVPPNTGIAFPYGATCVFKSPLTFPAVDNLLIEGNGATLLYEGTATTGTLVTLGTALDGCGSNADQVRNLIVTSTTIMTSGDGFEINGVCQLTIRDLTVGNPRTAQSSQPLYNGLHIQAGGGIDNVFGVYASGSNAGEIVNGGTTQQLTDFFSYNNVFEHSGVGLVVAGNCGGCYWDSTDAVNNTVANVRIDQSVVLRSNPQVRFGPNFASDGGPPSRGIDVEDPGTSAAVDGSVPLATNATNSFVAGATSIPVATCPATMTGSWYVFDRSLTPPRSLGNLSGCSGGSATISGSGSAAGSATASDNLYMSGGPGPGRHGSAMFFEGSWVSTNPGTCLYVAPNVNKEIHLIGARIENCPNAGIDNESDQIRVYISGGSIAQNGTGIVNNAAGAHIELQARPSMYGNTAVYGGSATLTPSILSGCGGSGAQVYPSDDYDFRVSWGATSGTTCQIALNFNHDSGPQSVQVSALGLNNYGWASIPITSNAVTFNFNTAMVSGNQFSAHLSGYSY